MSLKLDILSLKQEEGEKKSRNKHRQQNSSGYKNAFTIFFIYLFIYFVERLHPIFREKVCDFQTEGEAAALLMQMRRAESFLMPACNLRWHLSPLPPILSAK